jgi:hypothetical protein
MAGTIRARVKSGKLEPLDTLHLPEGHEVTVTTLDVPSERNVDAFRRAAGGRKSRIRQVARPTPLSGSGRPVPPSLAARRLTTRRPISACLAVRSGKKRSSRKRPRANLLVLLC